MHSDPSSPNYSGAIYAGRYSDGRSAQSVPADVRLTDRGIEIGFPGAPQALIWPYRALGAATPLSRKSTDALVTYEFMPGASLFVGDATFVQALMKASPQITSRAYGWQSAKPWVLAASAVGVVFAGLWAIGLSPARWVANMLPDRTRAAVGEQVINSMAGQYRTCDDTKGAAALDKLTTRLTIGAPKDQTFKVRVVDWNLLNAFAAPGEQIVLTKRIIQNAKSPEEVAGVLAHEMGHGLERHPETAIVRFIGMTAALELITGGGGTIANIGLGLTALSYTRSAEREADARALQLLEKAEISPSGIVDFFKRMGEAQAKTKGQSKETARTSEWGSVFSTHPDSEERARNAASKAAWRATPALSPDEWQALRAICGPEKAEREKVEPAKSDPGKGEPEKTVPDVGRR